MVSQVSASDVYTNLSGLNAIKEAGRADTSEGLKQVAKQFEAIFMNMILKSMRESSKVFSEGNYLSSNEMDFYQQNYDDQLSVHLTQGKGLGLADVLYEQLMRQYESSDSQLSEENASQSSTTSESSRESAPTRFSSPAEFVRALFPHAKKAADDIGVNPEMLLAQSALETGWGEKIVHDRHGGSSLNLFGIKADKSWQGPVAKTGTVEFNNGVAEQQQAKFRRYDSYAQSFDDYVDFLKSNPRYQAALTNTANPEVFAEKLQEAGYATDPDYSRKISQVMQSNTMRAALKEMTEGSGG